MKRELTLQFLQRTLPNPPWDEDSLRKILDDLRVLADYKYNKYEMYQPARLFFESLNLFLNRFAEPDRTTVLRFIREHLIFISREEFQQLAHVLYYDRIRQKQLDLAATTSGIPRYQLTKLIASNEFKRIQRASLYVALSDGARIDYFRRQNLDINNEQVLAAYYVGDDKVEDVLKELRKELGDDDALFQCVFFLDDFCGSGRTLLREVVSADVPPDFILEISEGLKGKLSFNEEKHQIEWNYKGAINNDDTTLLQTLSARDDVKRAIGALIQSCADRNTSIKGSLKRISTEPLMNIVAANAHVYFAPLLATEYSVSRLRDLTHRLPEPLNSLDIIPAASVSNAVRILPGGGEDIAQLCERYYDKQLEDRHTSTVMYGYDDCGLPVVLHHNTPNNSLYFLWARKWGDPLFPRFERHGREVRR